MRQQVAVWAFVVSWGLVFGWCAPEAAAQENTPAEAEPVVPPDVAALQQSWPSLSAADFVAGVKELVKQRSKWEAPLQRQFNEAYAAEAARRLTQTDAIKTQETLVVSDLIHWARTQLDSEQKQAVLAQLNAREEQTAELGFVGFQAKWRSQRVMGAGPEMLRTTAREWLSGRDLMLVPTPQLEWSLDAATKTGAELNTSLSARWTGTVRPPQNGQFTFSGSPLRVDLQAPTYWAKTVMQVWVDDQLVFDSTKPDQAPQAVPLSAAQPSALRVEWSHAHRGRTIEMQHPPVAMLYWEGDGVARQLVPSSALAPPAERGAGPGLWGEYSAAQGQDAEGREQPALTVARLDPQLAFAWTDAQSFLLPSGERALLESVVSELLGRYTGEDYQEGLFEQIRKDRRTADGGHWRRAAELMTPAQRSQLLGSLAGEEELLKRFTSARIKRTFQIFRPGAESESVDLVGRWIQVKPPVESVLTKYYFGNNRYNYFVLADYLTFEYPAGRAQLEEKYLTAPDGSCRLIAAYILGYSYGFTGELENWIAKLDAKLNDESLSGEARVDWLLARAQAEEIRGSVPQRFTRFPERYHAGWGWLDEASLMAASEPVRLRVLREKLARLGAMDQRAAAQTMLTENESRFTAEESQTKLAEWKKTLEAMAEQFDELQVQRAKEAQAAYVKELQRRLKKAQDADRTEAAAHYQQKLNALQPATPEN